MIRVTMTAALLCLQGGAAFAENGPLTVATWGGSYTEKQRATILDPFTQQSGVSVLDTPYTGGLGQIRAMVDAGNTTIDVIQMGAAETYSACLEGLVEPLEAARIPNLADYTTTPPGECGLPAVRWSMVIGYNTAAIGAEPQGWADFWDTERFPGKRGLRREAKYNLEAALMADGVPAARIYEVLGTPEGVDRAFAKLDELKPDIQWWEAGAQPAEWLATGSVAMSTTFIGRVLEAKAENTPVDFSWNGSIYSTDNWAIVAGSARTEAAYAFLDFAAGAEAQAAFSEVQPVAPANDAAIALLSEDRRAIMPVGDNLARGTELDVAFWNDNLEALTERFNVWLAR